MVKARPEASPHFRTEIGIDSKTPISRIHNRRRLTASGEQGVLGLLKPPKALVSAEPQAEEPHRSFWFKKGAGLYSLDFSVPRNPIEEENRRSQVLDEAMELEIDPQNLVYSKELGKWTIKAKKEHKSKLYGAFVIVDVHIEGRNGKDETVRRFVSLKDLQKPGDNPLARFKKVNG